MNVPKGYVLPPDQTAVPIRWLVNIQGYQRRAISDEAMQAIYGDDGTSKKLRSWGHLANGAHWLSTRGGTVLHRDPGYLRYTHHIIVRNDGFRIRGLSDDLHPPMVPGAMYCLDAVSPHQVVTDDRMAPTVMGRPIYKLQIAIDSNEIMSPAQVYEACLPLLTQDPLASFPEKYGSRAPQSW